MTASGAITPAARAGDAPSPRAVDALRVSLVLVLLTYVWRVQDLIPGLAPLKVPTIATVVAGVVILLDQRAARHAALASRHPVWRLVPWFAAAALASALSSIALRWSLDFLVRSLLPSLALALAVPAAVFTPRDARGFAGVQVAGALTYCAVILSEAHVDATGRLGRLVFYDANDLGLLLVCTLPLCVFFARHAAQRAWRGVALGTTLLFVFAIVRTGSRGAFLGLLVVALYATLRFRGMRAPARLALIAGLVATLAVGASDRYWNMMATLLRPSADYNWDARGGRMNIWDRGLRYMWDRPVSGVGLWAFPVAEGTLTAYSRRQEYGAGVKWSAAHNSFVQVGAEVGLPGLVLFVWMFVRAFRAATRVARDAYARGDPANAELGELAEAHAASLLGYVVSGFFLSQAYGPYLYFVFGMIIGLDVSARSAWASGSAQGASSRSRGTRHWRMPAARMGGR